MKLYLFDANQFAQQELFQNVLERVGEDRRKKALAYKFLADQRLSLGAGLLLERFLEEQGIPPDAVEISDTGKPVLPSRYGLHFNISHAGQYVLFGGSKQTLGVDIEKVQGDYLEVAEKFFTKEEQNTIFVKEDLEQQEDIFFRLWTLKESYMKATGLGFLLPLHKFSIALDGEKASFLTPKDVNREYRLQVLNAPIGYHASLCVSAKYQGELPQKPTVVTIEELL